MAAQCTVLGSKIVLSVGALGGGSGCVASAVYTGSVPPATYVTTATTYNPLATGATQQLDVIAPTIISFASCPQLCDTHTTSTTTRKQLPVRPRPAMQAIPRPPRQSRQPSAARMSLTTVANGAVVTNVVMVGAAEVDASVGVALAGTPTVLTSKSYVPVDLQFPTSASLSFTTADIDFTICCTVIAETFTAKGSFDAANPQHGQGSLTFTVQCNLPPNSRYKWDDDDRLNSAPNNHLDGTCGSSMVGSSVTNSQVTGVSLWSFSYNGGSGKARALCGTTFRFPVAVNVFNSDAVLNKCDDANFVDFNLLVLAVGTPSSGFSFSVATPKLGLSVNDGGDPLGANDEWNFRVYTGPSSSPPQQTFALTSLVADFSTDGGVAFTISGQVSIPVDIGHCFGISIARSADALVGQVKDISNATVFATISTDTVNYFTLLAYVIGSAPPTMTACAFIKPNLKARYRLRISIRLSTTTGLARRDSASSAGEFQSLTSTFEVDTSSCKFAGLSKRGVQEKVEVYKDLGAIVAISTMASDTMEPLSKTTPLSVVAVILGASSVTLILSRCCFLAMRYIRKRKRNKTVSDITLRTSNAHHPPPTLLSDHSEEYVAEYFTGLWGTESLYTMKTLRFTIRMRSCILVGKRLSGIADIAVESIAMGLGGYLAGLFEGDHHNAEEARGAGTIALKAGEKSNPVCGFHDAL
ncbi:hypothetical protein HDU78_010850 [Chytriomyces hyalinus]|nr:hypothetical protein HDU78_010850 [Chytriomyces hyalinus]